LIRIKARVRRSRANRRAMNTSPSSANAGGAASILDVRPIPGRQKHAQIFQRWFNLPVGEYFVLVNDHDPVPLYYQFAAEFSGAFSWVYLERGPEVFRVKLTKLSAVEPRTPPLPPGIAATAAPAPTIASNAAVQEIDVRGLEPPEPLIRILDRLESLPAGVALHARTDREPCHLFPEAEQRGFRTDCTAQPDGSYLTVLSRA
jgi:uncharacterized protein (DUF2249 family)